jgi:hypothetical protein
LWLRSHRERIAVGKGNGGGASINIRGAETLIVKRQLVAISIG